MKYHLAIIDDRDECGRTPHGVRGLKSGGPCNTPAHWRRTPHGVRGLKSWAVVTIKLSLSVAPRTGCVD